MKGGWDSGVTARYAPSVTLTDGGFNGPGARNILIKRVIFRWHVRVIQHNVYTGCILKTACYQSSSFSLPSEFTHDAFRDCNLCLLMLLRGQYTVTEVMSIKWKGIDLMSIGHTPHVDR